MLILGIILILTGALLGYFFPDQFVRFAAAVLVLTGVVLVIIAVLDSTGSTVHTSLIR